MALLGKGRVFVNLDALVTLDEGKDAPGTTVGTNGSEEHQIILFEGGQFFSVAPKPEPAIPEGFEQDAGVLVNRGAVVAAIPGGNLPIGTWCVLVNLAQLARS